MKTEKAIRLNTLLKSSMDIFWLLSKKNTLNDETLKNTILEFQNTDFDLFYNEFIDELKENIEEYQDIELIDNYMECWLKVVDKLDKFDDSINKVIVKNNFEVKFLLSARKILEFNLQRIYNITYTEDEQSSYSFELKRIFFEKMEQLNPGYDKQKIINEEKEDNISIGFDDRFTFLKLKAECALLEMTTHKVNLINERLLDFYQWQLLEDNTDSTDISEAYYYTKLYYPNFVKLCELELKRFKYESVKAPKKNISVIQATQNFNSDYSWKSSDTDLLELIVSLHKNESIQRNDGKPINRKELVSCFETMFSFRIKDVEGKLTKATNRNDKTPFLDSLKLAFENFAEEKEAKQRKRK